MGLGFVLSRALSGLLLTILPVAEGSSLAKAFVNAADKRRVRGLLGAPALLLAAAMLRMEQRGLHIVGHVHDEVILEEPVGTVTVEEVCSLMSEAPPWADGSDGTDALPLAAAGYKGDYYYKD